MHSFEVWPVLFQRVSWPGFNVPTSGDTDCVAYLVSGCELVFYVHSSSNTNCDLSSFRG